MSSGNEARGAAKIRSMKPVDDAARGVAGQLARPSFVRQVPGTASEPPSPVAPEAASPAARRSTSAPTRSPRKKASQPLLELPDRLEKDLTKAITLSLRGSLQQRLDDLVEQKGGKRNGWTRSSMANYILEQVLSHLETAGQE